MSQSLHLAHMPSGAFNANTAWLALAMIAFRLTRTVATIASHGLAKATAATIRTKIVSVSSPGFESPAEIRLAPSFHAHRRIEVKTWRSAEGPDTERVGKMVLPPPSPVCWFHLAKRAKARWASAAAESPTQLSSNFTRGEWLSSDSGTTPSGVVARKMNVPGTSLRA